MQRLGAASTGWLMCTSSVYTEAQLLGVAPAGREQPEMYILGLYECRAHRASVCHGQAGGIAVGVVGIHEARNKLQRRVGREQVLLLLRPRVIDLQRSRTFGQQRAPACSGAWLWSSRISRLAEAGISDLSVSFDSAHA